LNSAIGWKTLDIIMKNKLYENAEKMGEYFLGILNKLKEENLDLIENVRGRGLMDAVQFRSKEIRDIVEEECFQNGLLTLGCGYKALRFLPPLDVTKREIDIATEILKVAIENARKRA